MMRRDIRDIFKMTLAASVLVILSWWVHEGSRHGQLVLHDRTFVNAPGSGIVNSSSLETLLIDPLTSDTPGASNIVGMYAETFINPKEKGTMSHVSSLAPLSDGRMAAAWYSGSREGAKDVVVYLALYEDGRWGSASPVVSRSSARWELGRHLKKVGNAVLAADSSGRLWMFYASIVAGGWSGTSINYKISDDEGESWSASKKLVLSPFFNLTQNVKNNVLALEGGGFLLPVYHEFISKRSELVTLYPDGGYTKSRITNKGRAVQPSLISHGDGKIGAFMRNMSGKRVLYSESGSMGRRWGRLMDTSLSNPNAGLDVIGTEMGLVAVLNNLERGRHRLTIEHSPDGGRTWDELYVLEDSEGKEFSYPFIERGSDGIFHITYTHNREQIKHVTFDPAWLKWRISGSPLLAPEVKELPRVTNKPKKRKRRAVPVNVIAVSNTPEETLPALINAGSNPVLPDSTGDEFAPLNTTTPAGADMIIPAIDNSTGGEQ